MIAKGCDILMRKILFTDKPKHALIHNKCVASFEKQDILRTPQTIHIIYLGLIRSVCVGIAIFQSIPTIVRGLFHIGHPVQQFANFITMFSLLLINRSLEFKQMGF